LELTSITFAGLMTRVRASSLIPRRSPAAVGALLVAALGWATWQAVRPRPPQVPEPVYNSKPLSYWLAHPAPSHVDQAIIQDSNAIPFLIKALKRDRWIGAAFYRKQVWPKLPPSLQKHLPPPADDRIIRERTSYVLGLMRPLAKPAIPALIRALRDDGDLPVRYHAAIALGEVGEEDSNVVTALIEALNDEDTVVRRYAVRALGLIGQKGNKLAVVALTKTFNDNERDLRISAASALVKIGKGDSNVLIALTEALKDKDVHIRINATNTLLEIDPEAAAKVGVRSRETSVSGLKPARLPGSLGKPVWPGMYWPLWPLTNALPGGSIPWAPSR
jgi:hypothetical protein